MPTTRHQEKEELTQKTEADLQETSKNVADQIRKQSSLDLSVKEQGHQIESMKRADVKDGKQVEGTSSRGVGEIHLAQTPVSFDSYWRGESGNRKEARSEVRLPKLKFPSFDGSGPREWRSKCNRYFELHQILEEKKLGVTVSFESSYWRGENGNRRKGRSEVRLPKLQFPSFDGSGPREWRTCKEFGESDDNDIMEEFSKIRQKGTVEDYIDKFEELRAVLCVRFCGCFEEGA
ncbi:hypothetical protein M9H77_35659 [Catharanthus roseus]|uniref:Uncharacterized protein n=1 Tax=Catharanthus roseus TaxID=4058 RepID=A0ACB9ZPM4_CATRO|nr:hypothetical protein M9H77_35659 [Catharanthus roseus]